MKDIGLGILDPYTVAIVLITLVLSQVLFGNQIPLDTTNAAQLFVSLVVFTGYIYMARSIFRLPVAVVISWINFREKYLIAIKEMRKGRKKALEAARELNFLWEWLFKSIMAIVVTIIPLLFLVYLINFAEKSFNERVSSERVNTISKKEWVQFILGILDRIGIVLVAICATIPAFQIYVQTIGIVGIIFMVIIFLLKGSFVALIEDGLVKAEQKIEKEKEENASKKDQDIQSETNFRNAKRGETTSSCEVCGKICAKNEKNLLPRLCSLECRQKWFVSWDKDWCIGDGKERQLLNSLRMSGYIDYDERVKVINLLAHSFGDQADWALIAIIRDSCRIFQDADQSEIKEGILKIVQSRNYVLHILNACLTDENVTVAKFAAQVINNSDQLGDISIDYVEALLLRDDDELRLTAIKILIKYNAPKQLVNHLKEVIRLAPSSPSIIDLFSDMVPPEIDALKILQKNRHYKIREQATNNLIKLGIDSKEPQLVLEQITCPRCEEEQTINVHQDQYVQDATKATFSQRHFHRHGLITKCLACNLVIHVKLGSFTEHEMSEASFEEPIPPPY